MTKISWNYSEFAANYDKRPDYSENCLAALFHKVAPDKSSLVVDVGAGTGKLTLPLLRQGYSVSAVEPNYNMRQIGVDKTRGLNVSWLDRVGEDTGLPDNTFQAVFFGSSFNVVDQRVALIEVSRVLVAGGWFCCMWNHRDLNDPIQARIEKIISSHISR